jgi:hypothetical protein
MSRGLSFSESRPFVQQCHLRIANPSSIRLKKDAFWHNNLPIGMTISLSRAEE